MKKIIFSLLAISCMFACTKEELDLTTVDDGAVSFASSAISRVSDTSWDAGDKIGVYMSDAEFATAESYLYTNVPYTADYSSASTSFSPVRYSIYYPERKNEYSDIPVDFIAYFPYQDGVSAADNYQVDLSDQESNEIDLVVSVMLKDVYRSKNAVSLDFGHKLSKVVFNIEYKGIADSLYSQVGNPTITMNDIETKSTYNLFSDLYTEYTDATDVNMVVSASEDYDLRAHALVLPYVADSIKVTFNIFDNAGASVAYTAAIAGTFAVGQQTTYYVVVGPATVTIQEGVITPWEDNVIIELAPVVSELGNWDGSYVADLEAAMAELPLIDSAATMTIAKDFEALSYIANYRDTTSLYGDGGVLDSLYNLAGAYLASTFTLATAIDLQNNEWIPIKNFAGTFDGDGFTVSNLNSTNALFASTLKGSSITNLTVSGSSQIAGIVGDCAGSISYCTSNVTSNSGYGSFGVLVGVLSDTASYCSAYVNSASNFVSGIASTVGEDALVINCSQLSDAEIGLGDGAAIAQTNNGSIVNCSSYSISAQLVQNNFGTLTMCFSDATGSKYAANNYDVVSDCYSADSLSLIVSTDTATTVSYDLTDIDNTGIQLVTADDVTYFQADTLELYGLTTAGYYTEDASAGTYVTFDAGSTYVLLADQTTYLDDAGAEDAEGVGTYVYNGSAYVLATSLTLYSYVDPVYTADAQGAYVTLDAGVTYYELSSMDKYYAYYLITHTYYTYNDIATYLNANVTTYNEAVPSLEACAWGIIYGGATTPMLNY